MESAQEKREKLGVILGLNSQSHSHRSGATSYLDDSLRQYKEEEQVQHI